MLRNQQIWENESVQLFTLSLCFEGFDDFSNQSDTYRKLYEQAEDPYIYFRNQYIQGQRRDELFELSEREQQDNQ